MNSAIQMAHVRDGASQTYFFLEFAHFGNHSWVDFDEGANQFFWVHHVSQGYVTSSHHSGTPSPPNGTSFNNRGAHGDHPGGVLVTYVDGHLGFASDHIDYDIYRAQFTRAAEDTTSK